MVSKILHVSQHQHWRHLAEVHVILSSFCLPSCVKLDNIYHLSYGTPDSFVVLAYDALIFHAASDSLGNNIEQFFKLSNYKICGPQNSQDALVNISSPWMQRMGITITSASLFLITRSCLVVISLLCKKCVTPRDWLFRCYCGSSIGTRKHF